MREARDAEQNARRLHRQRPETRVDDVPRRLEGGHVGDVVVEPDDVREREPRLRQHRLEVVERPPELPGHIPDVQRSAVGTDGRLSRDEHEPLRAADIDRVREVEPLLPSPRIDRNRLHHVLLPQFTATAGLLCPFGAADPSSAPRSAARRIRHPGSRAYRDAGRCRMLPSVDTRAREPGGRAMALVFRQLFDARSATYTYLLADPETREAVLIDPVFEHARRDAALIRELELRLRYTLDTHVHADHVTGASMLRAWTGCRIAISAASGASGMDIALRAGDRIRFGEHALEARATPGHTNGCITFL